MPAKDRAFLLKLAKDLGLGHTIEVADGTSSHMLILELEEDDDESDEESMDARQRIFKRYDKMEAVDEEQIAADLEAEKKVLIDKEFIDWKASYYRVS